jgi:bleomycin hydrolase
MRFPLFLAFLIIALPLGPVAQAGYCEHLYAMGEKELAGVLPEFLAKHNNRYSHELPVTAVKDQCNYGSCWIYGTVANIETEFARRTGKQLSLSEPYLILRSLEERIAEALATPGKQLGEGGRYEAAQSLIEKYGALPADAWSPRIPFESNPHNTRLLTFIDHRIAKYHLDVASRAGSPKKLRRQAEKDLKELLQAYAGPLPKEFSFDGVQYTDAMDFGAYVAPSSGREVQTFAMKAQDMPDNLFQQRPKDGDSNKVFGSKIKTKFNFVTADELEKTIVAAVKNGKSVAISTEMSRAFIDRSTGIMSIEAMPMPKGFKPAPANYRSNFNISGGSHQMAIVGVDLDKHGRVIKYKIKNSWGAESGDAGFYHMYPDYFRTFAKSIVVH